MRKILFFLLLVSLSIQQGKTNCLGACGGESRGDCIQPEDGTDAYCVCKVGFTGDDCSIRNTAIHNGVEVTGRVGVREFHYYNIVVQPNTGGLNIQFTETSSKGDCDVYVKNGAFPSIQDYDYKDDTEESTIHIDISRPSQGTYYIGIFGYQGCSYTLTATTSITDCPRDCNGNGQCTEAVCVCNDGFFGAECNIAATRLTSSDIAGTADKKGTLYVLPLDSTVTAASIQLTKVDSSHDGCIVYIKKGTAATSSTYDQSNSEPFGSPTTISPISNDGLAGTYFVMVRARRSRRNCRYQIKSIVSVDSCSNQCSAHGTCVNNACVCNEGFEGGYCQTMTSHLELDTPVTGHVDNSVWNFYAVQVQSTNNILVSLSQGNDEADCDVYIKSESMPSMFDFDFAYNGFQKEYTVPIENPGDSVWWIGVRGFQPCDYTLTASLGSSCPSNCSGHGTCESGHCNCETGHAGPACEFPVSDITSGNTVAGTVQFGKWHFYKISAAAGTKIVSVFLTNIDAEGTPSAFDGLYLRKLAVPTSTEFNFHNEPTKSIQSLMWRTEDDAGLSGDTDFYVGVRGNNPDVTSDSDNNVSYHLSVWVAAI